LDRGGRHVDQGRLRPTNARSIEEPTMLVRDVMTSPVVSVQPTTPVRAAAALLTERGFTALPVVDADADLVGIATEADLLRDRIRHDARSPRLNRELTADPSPATVGEVMTRDVFSARPFTDIADLADDMHRLGIRSVPVVETGRTLVGIVSRRDILRTLTRADVAIATDVRRRLEVYAGPDRWGVDVASGVVTLHDPVGDPTEQHVATVMAASVRGVADVQVDRVED
jgi:CBS-domain-containing membrane protein